jgi:MFS family permease
MNAPPEAKPDTSAAAQPSAGGRAGVYFAFLQLVFTLGWTVYVVYLPKLATSVGIAPASVILILMLDQAIFTIADTAMGIAADRLAHWVGRLGVFVAVMALMSCAAFVALPFVAGVGPAAQIWFVLLIGIWAVTSSALRAPPLALLGRYAARPSLPILSALTMFGYGLAGVASPFLGGWLRDVDVRLPFVVSSLVLMITALALSKVERTLVAAAPPVTTPRVPSKPFGAVQIMFVLAMGLLALGFQFHLSINSTRLFLRYASADDLKWLTPVFWIGFNAALFPAAFLGKRYGALTVIGCSGLLGALALFGTYLAENLQMMVGAQFFAGAAWGFMVASAVTAAFAIGETGAEGRAVGLVYSTIALATFARMGVVAFNLDKTPDYAALIHWAPVACWLVAGLVVLLLASSRLRLDSTRFRFKASDG